MSLLDTAERLDQMVSNASAEAQALMQSVGRQMAGKNMYLSGNHVHALQNGFENLFDSATARMADFALRTRPPREASRAVDRAARRLEANLSDYYREKLSELNVLPTNACNESCDKFERALRTKLNAVVTDTQLNVVGHAPGSRGFISFCQRNAWLISLTSAGISLVSLYVGWK